MNNVACPGMERSFSKYRICVERDDVIGAFFIAKLAFLDRLQAIYNVHEQHKTTKNQLNSQSQIACYLESEGIIGQDDSFLFDGAFKAIDTYEGFLLWDNDISMLNPHEVVFQAAQRANLLRKSQKEEMRNEQ